MALYNELKKRGLTFTTNVPNGATYIMNDGKFLDLVASKQVILREEFWNEQYVLHPNLDVYLRRNKLIEEYHRKPLVLTDNAIALNDGSVIVQEYPYFVLPESRPTNKQYDALEEWLTNLMAKKDYVEFVDRRKQVIKQFYFQTLERQDGWLPEDIVTEAKKVYNN